MEQYFQEPIQQLDEQMEGSQPQKWKSISEATITATPTSENTANGCFDCNICLDNAHEPVVTLCGHLYCWPCIYKWLHLQTPTDDQDQKPQCPVCKSNISSTTLVPLYGRGESSKLPLPESENSKEAFRGLQIPRRPSGSRVHDLISTSPSSSPTRPIRRQLHQNIPQPMFSIGGTTTMNAIYPMVELFGEMVYPRVFGNSDGSMYRFQDQISSSSSRSYYQAAGNSSPRVRRQEMQAEKSLNRISIFLFCCLVLCLLLF